MPILYKVVVGSLEDLVGFETAVAKYLNEGYIPAGGIAYGTDGKLVQSVARNTDIPIGPPMGPMGPMGPQGPRPPPGGGRPVMNQ
jgi:hypothetical protein